MLYDPNTHNFYSVQVVIELIGDGRVTNFAFYISFLEQPTAAGWNIFFVLLLWVAWPFAVMNLLLKLQFNIASVYFIFLELLFLSVLGGV
jgi:hypothetical protein